jgi:hypothetical protein
MNDDTKQALQRAERELGPWFSDDDAGDILWDVKAFDRELADLLSAKDIARYIHNRPTA